MEIGVFGSHVPEPRLVPEQSSCSQSPTLQEAQMPTSSPCLGFPLTVPLWSNFSVRKKTAVVIFKSQCRLSPLFSAIDIFFICGAWFPPCVEEWKTCQICSISWSTGAHCALWPCPSPLLPFLPVSPCDTLQGSLFFKSFILVLGNSTTERACWKETTH